MKALINALILDKGTLVKDKVLLFNDKIIDIVSKETFKSSVVDTIIDAKGAYVSAGFIDLHIHGSGGVDVMDATPDALHTLSNTLLETGTTAFLATTMTMSSPKIKAALQTLQEHAHSVKGAEIVGVHLEGPFIHPQKHGAQDPRFIQPCQMDFIAPYLSIIKMITLAPEREGAKAFIQTLQKEYPHIVLSIGHSNASYAQAMQSFDWGVSHATHLFNAMNPYHHREPGIVGAVFDSEVTCDMIADGIHTHASTLRLVHQMKKEKLLLITDAMRAGCMKQGIYELGGQKVTVKQKRATLEDGTLAGSVLKLNEALRMMVSEGIMSRIEAVNAVTKTVAQKLGLSKGELKKGYDADIVIFDEDFSIISTIVHGEQKYQRK